MNRLISLLFVEKTVRQFWGPFAFLFVLFLALGVVCLYFRNDIFNQQEYVVMRENIRVVAPPSWITGDFVTETLQLLPVEYRDQICGENEGDLRLNANDPRLVGNLRAAALKHPLVESVKEIAVHYPATVALELNFRVPVALVDPSPDFQESFRDDLRKRFPDDLRYFEEQNRLRAGVESIAEEETNDDEDDEEEEGEETKNARKRARYIVDRTGKILPTKYFTDHPDAYLRLPRVAGITSTSASASADPIVEEAGAFARFLDETNATSDWRIESLGVLREYGSTRGVWFFKTSGGAIVKWGRFARPAGSSASPSYAPNSKKRDPRKDWKTLYDFQFRKFEELRKRILDNDARVAMLARSEDFETQKNAEKSRLKTYDVSDFLRDEEDPGENARR